MPPNSRDHLMTFELAYVETVTYDTMKGPPTRVLLWQHRCFDTVPTNATQSASSSAMERRDRAVNESKRRHEHQQREARERARKRHAAQQRVAALQRRKRDQLERGAQSGSGRRVATAAAVDTAGGSAHDHGRDEAAPRAGVEDGSIDTAEAEIEPRGGALLSLSGATGSTTSSHRSGNLDATSSAGSSAGTQAGGDSGGDSDSERAGAGSDEVAADVVGA